MAFMALFGWIFIPIILLGLIFQAVAAPLRWAAAHPVIVNVLAAGLLVLNLLLFLLFLRFRKRRRQQGQRGILLLLAALWEAWAVLLCVLFLIFQPLQYIPEDFGQFPSSNTEIEEEPEEPAGKLVRDPDAPPYLGTWTVTECLGTASEAPMDPDLIEKTIGAELHYWAESVMFQRTDFGGGCGGIRYKESDLTAEDFAEIYGTTLEALGLDSSSGLSVTLEDIRSSDSFFEDLGGRFLLLDEETMLLCSKGAFFRAELVPESWPTIRIPEE